MSARTNAQSWLGIRLLITDDPDLIVEVKDSEILVRSRGGSVSVTYKKSPDVPQLVLKSEWLADRRENALRLAHFRARAWRLANDTANERGWFKVT
jgi:hypothetical protein